MGPRVKLRVSVWSSAFPRIAWIQAGREARVVVLTGTPRIGPGVVTQESRAAEQLLLDGRRGGLEVDQVSDKLVG